MMVRAVIGVFLFSCIAGCAAVPDNGAGPRYALADEASLRSADSVQQAAVIAGDVQLIHRIMHPDYRVNAPTNRVMTRAEILGMFDQGIISAEPIERTVESAVVTGTTGIVMGRERLVPAPGSEMARASGGQVIHRRFTNIYSFENGQWWFLGRHFNEVQP